MVVTATKKRFYRKTGILYSGGKYEVTLDQRKLKTPSGKPFQLESEPLALAVATEWDAQKDKIQQSTMHLTALCSTALDNPNKLNKLDMVQYMVDYLDTDTVLFQSTVSSSLPDELHRNIHQDYCRRTMTCINFKCKNGIQLFLGFPKGSKRICKKFAVLKQTQ